jgi:hypothetical protein
VSGPAVTVLIPAYNCGPYVAESVGSALTQTFRDREVLVIDDGSTDDTAARLAPFASRIRYVRQDNQGIVAARNRGIELARGRYVALLDADDIWLPSFLERTIARLEADARAAVAYSWWGYIDESSKVLPELFRKGADGDVLEPLFMTCFVTPSCTVLRRGALDSVGAYDPAARRAEDYDLLLRIAAAGYHFALVPETLMQYRVRPGSLSHDIAGMAAGVLAAVRRAGGHDRYRALGADLVDRAVRNHQLAWAGAHFRHREWPEGAALLEPVVAATPELLSSLGFHLGLMTAMLPVGHRTPANLAARLPEMVNASQQALDTLFARDKLAGRTELARRARATLWLAAAVAGPRRRMLTATSYVLRPLLGDPGTVPRLATSVLVQRRHRARAARPPGRALGRTSSRARPPSASSFPRTTAPTTWARRSRALGRRRGATGRSSSSTTDRRTGRPLWPHATTACGTSARRTPGTSRRAIAALPKREAGMWRSSTATMPGGPTRSRNRWPCLRRIPTRRSWRAASPWSIRPAPRSPRRPRRCPRSSASTM